MHQPVTREGDKMISRFEPGAIRNNLAQSAFFRSLWAIIKLVAGLALLIVSIWGIRWENLFTGIRSANLTWLAVAIATIVVGFILKLWRWALFIRNYHIQTGIARLFSAYFVGQAANIILPVRGGDLIRLGYFTGEKKEIPAVATTIIIEKYLDLLALTVCGILVSLKFSIDNILNLRGWLLPVTVILTLVFAATILFGPIVWKKLRVGRRLPGKMIEWMDGWVQASEWLNNPRMIAPGILLTILIWCVMLATNLLLFKSLGLNLGGTAAGLVLISTYLGMLPALMPGNIGPYYFFARIALIPFGILTDQAIVFAVVKHAIVTLPPLIGGAIGLLIRQDRKAVT